MFWYDIMILELNQSVLERSGREGDTPVGEEVWDLIITRVAVLGSGQ